jgi:hypothetical protein
MINFSKLLQFRDNVIIPTCPRNVGVKCLDFG